MYGRSNILSGAVSAYSTNFPTIENPLSESGKWINTDVNSTLPQVSASGKCHGTQIGSTAPPYNDSQAWYYLDFSENAEVEMTVDLANGLDSTNREVECLHWMGNVPTFSTSFGNSQTDGFETNWQHQGSYLIWGRFKRAEIDRIASPPAANHGDKYRVRVTKNGSGNTECRVWINDVAKTWTNSGTTIATYLGDINDPTGNKFPLGRKYGIGFWKDSSANNNEFWASAVTLRNV